MDGAAQLADLRDSLREAATNKEGAELFAALYPSWSHSAGALLSLCKWALQAARMLEVCAGFSAEAVTAVFMAC